MTQVPQYVVYILVFRLVDFEMLTSKRMMEKFSKILYNYSQIWCTTVQPLDRLAFRLNCGLWPSTRNTA